MSSFPELSERKEPFSFLWNSISFSWSSFLPTSWQGIFPWSESQGEGSFVLLNTSPYLVPLAWYTLCNLCLTKQQQVWLSPGPGEVSSLIFCDTEVGDLLVVLLLEMPNMWRSESPLSSLPVTSWMQKPELRRSSREIAPCHRVVFIPKLTPTNGKLILSSLIQKWEAPEFLIYLIYPHLSLRTSPKRQKVATLPHLTSWPHSLSHNVRQMALGFWRGCEDPPCGRVWPPPPHFHAVLKVSGCNNLL